MERKQLSLFKLFLIFAKISIMTFGGGYAMLPIMRKEIIEKRGWMSDKEFMDFFAISQMTPGVVAVNAASMIGYQQRGIAGAIWATIGVVTPSILFVYMIASTMSFWLSQQLILQVFTALKIGVCVLILNAVFPFFKEGLKNAFGIILFSFVLIGFMFFKISPVLIVILCGAAGIIRGLSCKRKI
jgi:chromate transporter